MKKYLLLAFSFIAAISCNPLDEFENLEFEPLESEWAIPLVKSRLNFGDLIKRETSNFTIGSDDANVLFALHQNSFTTRPIRDFFTIPPVELNNTVSAPIDAPSVLNGGETLSLSADFSGEFEFENATELSQISARSGVLSLTIINRFNHPISDFELRIPGLSFSGEPLTINGSINANTGTSNTLSLNAAVFDLFFDEKYNQIPVEFEAVLQGNGNPINAGDNVEINLSFTDIEHNQLVGYFDTFLTEENSRSLDIDFFSNTIFAEQSFDQIDMTYRISNSVSIPASLEIQEIKGTLVNNGELQIENTNTDSNTLKIGAKNELQSGSVSSPVQSIFNLGPNNSNVGAVVSASVTNITTRERFNLGGGPVDHSQVIDSDATFGIEKELLLPFIGTVVTHQLRDTTTFSAFENLEVDLLNELEVRVGGINQIPLDIQATLHFLDASNELIFSLFAPEETGEEFIIKAAVVNGNGESQSASEKSVATFVSSESLKRIQDVRFMVIEGNFRTSDLGQQAVKIRTIDEVEISIGVKANLNIEL